MLYISLDFSFFPLIFPPFLGIDHLENVSMRCRYPKVLGYRVLGIDIDPALQENREPNFQYGRPNNLWRMPNNLLIRHLLNIMQYSLQLVI